MKLCVISPYPPEISGIGQYGSYVVRGLARTGRFDAITVLAGDGARRPNPRCEPVDAGESSLIRTRYVWARDDVGAGTRLAAALRAEQPDVVWFNLGFAVFGASRIANFLGLAVPMFTRRAGLPTVVTLHESFESVHPRTLGMTNGRITAWGAHMATRMLLQADVVCVTLARYVLELRARYGVENVWHVPVGVYTPPELLPRPADAPPHNILIFATYAPFKGLPILLEAFAGVRQCLPEATLTIAGSDHPRFPGYLTAQRASANGAPGIQWLGPQPEARLRDLFARASVVVLPYTATTGASSVLHRAAALGRPMIMSDLPDLRTVAEEENLRVDYVPAGDPAALGAALIRLLQDPARQAAHARHNMAMMQAMTLDHTSARYVAAYEHALRRREQMAA